MVNFPLYENNRSFLLSKSGPEIRKSSGQGKVLILPEIKEISSWSDPARQMHSLQTEFNFWMHGHYQIKKDQIDNMPYYKIDKVKK